MNCQISSIQRLIEIVALLRSENGCPWDREQTLESLKQHLIEECYEVVDVIDSNDSTKHCEELGDLLLQVVFQAQIRQEEGAFGFDDVIDQVCEKLIRRHPHVFGDAVVSGPDEVLRNWEAIKAQEKRDLDKGSSKNAPRSAVDGVPRSLPALRKAHLIQARAARIGFDWDKVEDVFAKVKEELDEVENALSISDRKALEEELGDLLFSVVNLARFNDVNSEDALNRAVDKFVRRFKAVEKKVAAESRDLSDCGLDELDVHWNSVKTEEV